MNTVPHAKTLEQTMDLPNTKLNAEPIRAVGTATGTDTIGRLLVDAGKIKPQDVDRVLKLVQEQKIRFGEAAIRLGLIKEADVQKVLAHQFDYAYLTPGQGKFSPDLIAAYQPFSEQAEALRALRNQLTLRWLLLVVDAMFLGAVGLVAMLVTSQNQRIGDLMADTLVVRSVR